MEIKYYTTPEVIKSSSTNKLLDLFELTADNSSKNIYIVRGWIMDELEARNPAAFSAWLDLDAPEDNDLRKYIDSNPICYKCKGFLKSCPGTKNQVYTGCIYRVY